MSEPRTRIESIERQTSSEITTSEEGELIGYAVTWGFDEDGIRFERGSFKKTLAERGGKIPLLVRHDKDGSSIWETVGFVQRGEDDEKGLVITASFLDEPFAQRVREKAKNGGVKALSINAKAVKKRVEGDILVSSEAKLKEVTLTNIPADPDSEILAVRENSEEDTPEEEPEETTPAEEPSSDDEEPVVDTTQIVRDNKNLITLLEME